MRRTFWDTDSGSEYIADWENDHWEFAEREWGGVIWRTVPPKPELLRKLDSMINALVKKLEPTGTG
jgi:hypothetical protein